MNKKILVAVIAFNEQENITNTLKELQSSSEDIDIVVIDNGSSDETRATCLSLGIKTLSHCTNTGGSMGTVMTYFLYAFKNNYEILCQFDGDGQHITSELPKIIKPIANGEADYVIGSRFLTKEGFQSYFFRRIGITIFSWLDSAIIGKKVTDVTSGFRAYNTKVIKFFATKFRHELNDTNQLLLLSHFAGARIHEVPVKMRDRKFGVSEFHSINALVFPLKGIVNIIGCVLSRKLRPAE